VHVAEDPTGLGQHPPAVLGRKLGELLGQVLAVDALGDEIRRHVGVGIVLVDEDAWNGDIGPGGDKIVKAGLDCEGDIARGLELHNHLVRLAVVA